MLHRCVSVLCVLALMSFGVGMASAVTYSFTDLGAIGGNTSYGYSVNASGQVTGLTGTGGTSSQAYIYKNGTMSYLNHDPYLKGSYGYAINSGGAVAGAIDYGTGMLPPYWGAAMWTATGTLQYIGLLPGAPSTGQSYAYGISNSGQVVGKSPPASGNGAAFYWTQAGGMVDLGRLPGSAGACAAFDISSVTGHIVGTAVDSGGTSRAVFFDYNTPGNLTILANMPTVSAAFNGSMAVNDNDWVVAAGHYVWKPDGGGTVINIWDKFTAAGIAYSSINSRCDINNAGVVSLSAVVGGVGKAYIYDAVHDTITDVSSLTMTGLPTGFAINYAYSIGNGGHITGAGTPSGGGATHAYLLTPTPEPSTLLLMVSGLAGLLAYAWRRRK
jgi:probable HAF family extracellular repeat protein